MCLKWFFHCVFHLASHPPTIHPHIVTTEPSNDVFDDIDNDVTVTDDSNNNIVNIVDKSNFWRDFAIILFLFVCDFDDFSVFSWCLYIFFCVLSW